MTGATATIPARAGRHLREASRRGALTMLMTGWLLAGGWLAVVLVGQRAAWAGTESGIGWEASDPPAAQTQAQATEDTPAEGAHAAPAASEPSKAEEEAAAELRKAAADDPSELPPDTSSAGPGTPAATGQDPGDGSGGTSPLVMPEWSKALPPKAHGLPSAPPDPPEPPDEDPPPPGEERYRPPSFPPLASASRALAKDVLAGTILQHVANAGVGVATDVMALAGADVESDLPPTVPEELMIPELSMVAKAGAVDVFVGTEAFAATTVFTVEVPTVSAVFALLATAGAIVSGGLAASAAYLDGGRLDQAALRDGGVYGPASADIDGRITGEWLGAIGGGASGFAGCGPVCGFTSATFGAVTGGEIGSYISRRWWASGRDLPAGPTAPPLAADDKPLRTPPSELESAAVVSMVGKAFTVSLGTHAVGYTLVTAGTLEAPPVAAASGVAALATGGLAAVFSASTGAVDGERLNIAYREDDHELGPVMERTTAEIIGEWIGAGLVGTTATAVTFASGPVTSIPVSTSAALLGAAGGHIIADKLYGNAGVTPSSSSRRGR